MKYKYSKLLYKIQRNAYSSSPTRRYFFNFKLAPDSYLYFLDLRFILIMLVVKLEITPANGPELQKITLSPQLGPSHHHSSSSKYQIWSQDNDTWVSSHLKFMLRGLTVVSKGLMRIGFKNVLLYKGIKVT